VKTVVVSGTNGSSPVVVGHVYPEFKGALIVCDGGNLPAVQLRIVESVSALTGLGSDRITVMPMDQKMISTP
jgi:stage III sporulation protein AG